MRLTVRSERIADARPLLDIAGDLPDVHRSVFVRDGDGFVAAGESATVDVPSGTGRMAAARERLEALLSEATVDDAVDLPGSGAIAIGSFTFDPAAAGSVLRVPQALVGRRDGITWRTTITTDDRDPLDVAVGSGVRPPTADDADRPRYAGSTVEDAAWLEAIVGTVEAIRRGRFAKAVLARDVLMWSRTPFAVDEVLERLTARFPSCFTFLVDGLIGASPELLLRRNGAKVASRVLAGTAPRGRDATDDARLGATLLASEKDRWEHDLAARSVTDVLGRFCSSVVVPEGPALVRLDNVQHLGSDVTGILADDVHVLDLLDALHPTAAVAGTPRDAALAHIRDVEGMDRGRYAGPVGWCDADGDGEFAIALRCAEINGTRARLFAGAGIVDGSLPEAELMETWLKLRAMTDVLTRR